MALIVLLAYLGEEPHVGHPLAAFRIFTDDSGDIRDGGKHVGLWVFPHPTGRQALYLLAEVDITLGSLQQHPSIGSDTNYLWDEQGYGNAAIEETGGSVTNYVLGNDQLLFQNRVGTISYYLPDGTMNVRQLANSSGTVTDKYSYDAYGNTTHGTGSNANPYQYKGQQYDQSSKLYNLRARYYTPTQGRFLSRDTASFDYQNPRELNRYGYVGDDSVNAYDPGGHLIIDYALILQPQLSEKKS